MGERYNRSYANGFRLEQARDCRRWDTSFLLIHSTSSSQRNSEVSWRPFGVDKYEYAEGKSGRCSRMQYAASEVGWYGLGLI